MNWLLSQSEQLGQQIADGKVNYLTSLSDETRARYPELAHYAMQAASDQVGRARIYQMAPMSAKQNNWSLLMKVVRITELPHYMTQFWRIADYIPPTMRACIVYFGFHPPAYMDVYGEDFVEEYNERYPQNNALNEEPPHLTLAEAQAWVDNDPLVGYSFLPEATQLAYPTLARALIRRRPPVLSRIPDAVLHQNIPDLLDLLRDDPWQYAELSDDIRETHEELTAAMIEHLNAITTNPANYMLLFVPTNHLERHFEWATTFLKRFPQSYNRFSLAFMLANPLLTQQYVTSSLLAYERLPLTIKEGNYHLARLAVSSSYMSYRYVPQTMRDVERAANELERTQIVDLALLALTTQRFPTLEHNPILGPQTRKAFQKTALAAHTDVTAMKWRLLARDMSQGTRKALLIYLYKHDRQLLRQIEEFESTRENVGRMEQNRLLDFRRMPVDLPKEQQEHIIHDLLGLELHSVQHDHEAWGLYTLRTVWLYVNKFLFKLHRHRTADSLEAASIQARYHLRFIITQFCNPALSDTLVYGDNATAPSATALSESNQAFFDWMTHQAHELIAVLYAAYAFADLPTEAVKLNHQLVTWTPSLFPSPNLQMPSLVMQYLAKPRVRQERDETMFLEDYASYFPFVFSAK